MGTADAFDQSIGPQLPPSLGVATASILARGAEAQAQVPGEVLAVLDVKSGQIEPVQGKWRVERLLCVDESQQEFVAVSATEEEVLVRTIAYGGEVTATTDIPGMARWWTIQDLETFAVSPNRKAVVYNDRADECIYTLDLQTEDRKPILKT